MQRIKHPTAQGGRFTEGDPQTGTPATLLTADWANTVQEELAGLLEGLGVALDPTNNSQLLQLFRRLNRPSLAFGDFFPVDDSAIEGSVVATFEVDGYALVLTRDGKLLRFIGRHCKVIHSFEMNFGEQTWMFIVRGHLAIVTLQGSLLVTQCADFAGDYLDGVTINSLAIYDSSGSIPETARICHTVFDPVNESLLAAVWFPSKEGEPDRVQFGLIEVDGSWICGRSFYHSNHATDGVLALDAASRRLAVVTWSDSTKPIVAVMQCPSKPGDVFVPRRISLSDDARVLCNLEDHLMACGVVRATWAPEFDAVAVTYFVGDETQARQRFALVDFDGTKRVDTDAPKGFYLQSAFHWGRATFFLGFSVDFARLAFFSPSRTGWLQRAREWPVDKDRLRGALAAIQYSGSFPKTLVLPSDNLVLVTIEGESFAMTDPVYAPLVRSRSDNQLTPIALCSDGRRLAWCGATRSFSATTKLF